MYDRVSCPGYVQSVRAEGHEPAPAHGISAFPAARPLLQSVALAESAPGLPPASRTARGDRSLPPVEANHRSPIAAFARSGRDLLDLPRRAPIRSVRGYCQSTHTARAEGRSEPS